MTERVLISRLANDTVNGVRRTGRVYVTGPHFGQVFSSTEKRAEASRFGATEAARLVASKWRHCDPRVEPETLEAA